MHFFLPHTFQRSLIPVQFAPPYCGGGVSHSRLTLCQAAPHVLGQGSTGVHDPHLPSTVMIKVTVIAYITSTMYLCVFMSCNIKVKVKGKVIAYVTSTTYLSDFYVM